MQRRGRSRQISPVALARQASEERRLDELSAPQSLQDLQDQLHVAYALDDFHLAKILLLKLQGIQVTSHNDPRIDQVSDQDFDIYFVPSQLEEHETPIVQETRRKQRERCHDPQRTQRLRICQKIWDEEKQRLHAERIVAIRRRKQVALEALRTRIAAQQLTQRANTLQIHTSSSSSPNPFQYNFMRPTLPSPISLPPNFIPNPSRTHHRTVSFKQVVSSMNGDLFPLDTAERAEHARRIAGITTLSSSSTHRRQSSVRSQLLHTLLDVFHSQQGKRPKQKAIHLQPPPHSNTPTPLLPVPSTDSMPPTSISSSISTSRSNSWLSFGSWCSSLTDITSPESSSTISNSPKSSQSSLRLPALCESPHHLMPSSISVPISLDETPLSPPKPHSNAPQLPSPRPTVKRPSISTDTRGLERMGTSLVRHLSRSVHNIVDAAKGLQSAYMAASMFSIYTSPSPSSPSSSQSPQVCSSRSSLQRYGYRAHPTDVKKFAVHTAPPATATSPEAIHFIPLVSPFPVTLSAAPLIVLRSPSSHSFIIPSPLRPRIPPTALAYRMRPVANPEILRLRALQNLMCARGKAWEGRGREGGRGCGKERMLGIAFEGRGPSNLGCEVRLVVA